MSLGGRRDKQCIGAWIEALGIEEIRYDNDQIRGMNNIVRKETPLGRYTLSSDGCRPERFYQWANDSSRPRGNAGSIFPLCTTKPPRIICSRTISCLRGVLRLTSKMPGLNGFKGLSELYHHAHELEKAMNERRSGQWLQLLIKNQFQSVQFLFMSHR